MLYGMCRFFQKINDYASALRFLVLSKCNDEAFHMAEVMIIIILLYFFYFYYFNFFIISLIIRWMNMLKLLGIMVLLRIT